MTKGIFWISRLSKAERTTYAAAFAGEALDSFDATMFALLTPSLIVALGMTKADAGLLASASLVSGAVGGWLGGILADRYGRVFMLQLTILLVALSTCAAAFANGFPYLLAVRAVQGLGNGAELAITAVLIMEAVGVRLRSRVASSLQSSYAVGNAISVALFPLAFALLPPDLAWRVMLGAGIAPAIAVIAIRRLVPEPAVFVERAAAQAAPPPFWTIFSSVHRPRLTVGTLFVTAVLGGAYVLISWLPTYLTTVLHLKVGSTAGYLAINILGSFCGPLAFGFLADRFDRRRVFRAFLVLQAVNVLVYTQIGITWQVTFVLGFFLGFLQAGIASGLKPTLAELFPTGIRAGGVGFTLTAGRGLGSILPATVGYLAIGWHLGTAMATCGVAAYAAAVVLSLFLPREARGVALGDIGKGLEAEPPAMPTAARLG